MNRKPKSKQHEADLDRLAPWQHHLHEIIFEADTRAGHLFDVALFALIGLSIVVVMSESAVTDDHLRQWLFGTEIVLTILFTIEYVLRILSVGRPWHYVFSFFGVVDLLAILPTYIFLVVWLLPADAELTRHIGSLTVVRALRLLRVFRVLKLAQYLSEANLMLLSLRRTTAKITVFLMFVLVVCLILGTSLYVIEGQNPRTDFENIPVSVYWAIVTVTTVGYGDMAPDSWLGQTVAAIAMIIGYSIIVVPTGIVTAEIMTHGSRTQISTQACRVCSREGHDSDAEYCKFCGAEL